jgi:hypothetical protein
LKNKLKLKRLCVAQVVMGLLTSKSKSLTSNSSTAKKEGRRKKGREGEREGEREGGTKEQINLKTQ